jgi:hypothetical protein
MTALVMQRAVTDTAPATAYQAQVCRAISQELAIFTHVIRIP